MASSITTRMLARRLARVSQQRAYNTGPRSLPQLNEKIGERAGRSGGQGQAGGGRSGGTGGKVFSWLSLTGMSIGAGYIVGCVFPTDFALIVRPRPPAAFPDRDSKEGQAHAAQLEKEINQLDIVQTMRTKVKEDGWKEYRPYSEGTIDDERRVHSLIGGILQGPGRFAIPAICFASENEQESIYVAHIGRSMCGHDGIVHGGLLATMLDEGMGRPAIKSLPSQIGVTARLEVNYRKATKADQFVIMRTRCSKVEGRKAYVEASIEDIKGNTLVEASSLFVEPRFAKFLPGVQRALGVKGM